MNEFNLDVIDHGKVMGRKRITKVEARVVLDHLLRKHDATQGVNWYRVGYAIYHVLGTE